MAATSFAPLRTRIYEVLVDGNGATRALAAADRCSRRVHPGDRPDVRAAKSRKRRTCFVVVESAQPWKGHSSAADHGHYRITVRVEVYYYAGEPYTVASVARAQDRAADDMHRFVAALEASGNLAATEAAASTGLAGGALRFTGWSQRDPDLQTQELRATLRFEGIVDVTNP